MVLGVLGCRGGATGYTGLTVTLRGVPQTTCKNDRMHELVLNPQHPEAET